MKQFYISLLGIFFSMSLYSQTQTTGKIIDANNQNPLEGAKIEIGEKTVSSNREGIFSFICSPGLSLKISYLGYETYKTTISNCNTFLTISLQPSNNNLGEVQLTGVMNDTKKSLRNPVSVVELSQKELKRGTGLYLDDAINANIPGVIMERRAVSSGQQFNIRGYGNGVGFKGANNNFDGQGYKVYLNNIPITDAEGVTLLDDIDFSSISDVDVIKGPAGTKYGLAIAGVVNLETVRPQPGQTSLSQSVIAGKYGLLRLTSQLQIGRRKIFATCKLRASNLRWIYGSYQFKKGFCKPDHGFFS